MRIPGHQTVMGNDAYNAAFSVADQDRIITANLSNPDNAIWGTEGGNDTNDKVFCLNVDEIRKYYSLVIKTTTHPGLPAFCQ